MGFNIVRRARTYMQEDKLNITEGQTEYKGVSARRGGKGDGYVK